MRNHMKKIQKGSVKDLFNTAVKKKSTPRAKLDKNGTMNKVEHKNYILSVNQKYLCDSINLTLLEADSTVRVSITFIQRMRAVRSTCVKSELRPIHTSIFV